MMHNIVILSAPGGDDVAARAIKEQFDLRYKDCRAIIIPIEEYAGRMLATINDGFFTFCCRFAPWLFGIYYKFAAARITRKLKKLGEKYPAGGAERTEGNPLYSVKKIKNIYDRLEPEVIVSVNPLPHGLAVTAKKKYNFNCKAVAVISDYALDKLYVRYGDDGYVVDNHEMKKEFKALNFEDEKIKVYGLAAFNKYLVKTTRPKRESISNCPTEKPLYFPAAVWAPKNKKRLRTTENI